MMASVGIGMGHLHITVNEQNNPRGSEVTGMVELEGGIAVQHVRSVTLKLVAYRPSGKSVETKELSSWMAARSVDLLPHSRQSYSFKFLIPDETWLSHPPNSSRPVSGCRIDADADIAFAINPRCSLPLRVTVHREILAVQSAMRRLGFKDRRPGLSVTLTNPPPNRVVVHYRPPKSLEEQLDRAILSLQVEGPIVTGELDLDPHEAGLRDKMKALVLTQYQVFPLEFERHLLLTADGAPNSDFALPRMHDILAESLVLPDNENMRLLRPASGPKGDTLLRPAIGASRAKPSELLRPATEEKPA